MAICQYKTNFKLVLAITSRCYMPGHLPGGQLLFFIFRLALSFFKTGVHIYISIFAVLLLLLASSLQAYRCGTGYEERRAYPHLLCHLH